MASESNPSKTVPQVAAPEDWRRRDTLLTYLRDVGIAAAVMGLALFVYYRHVETGKQVRALGKEAKEFLVKDTPPGYVEAEKRLLSMIELDSEFPFAIASLAELYSVRWTDLGLDSDAAKSHEWTKKADATDARINERYGAVILELLADKKFAEAEKYATEITKVAASSHVVNGLGRAYRGQGKLDEARIALKKAADTEWRNPRFACDLADLYFEDGDYANAYAFYGKGIEANSEHPRSLIGRSRAAIARGQKVKEAADTLNEVLARPPEQLSPRLKAQALTAMAELRLFEQKIDEALRLANEAVAAYPAYPWAHFALARANAAAKAGIPAGQALDKAIELDRYVPEFYYVGANAMADAGDAAKATGLLDLFLKNLREDDRLHLAYGNLLVKLQRPDEALAHFDKAIDLNSFNAQAHYAKGAALFDFKKEHEKAKAELELALEVQEYYPAAYVKLGELLFDKKQWADGCQLYAQALVQMKQLQTPREKLTELRDRINDVLIKQARDRTMAKAWMEETSAMIR